MRIPASTLIPLALTVLIALIIAPSCARNDQAGGADQPELAADRHGPSHGPSHGAAAKTGGDQGIFRPEQVKWQDGPPSLPPGAQFAVLEGDPAKPGYFAMRLKLPAGYTIPPHTHPNVERITVLSGTLHLGMGSAMDKSKGAALMVGTYAFMPPEMKHFAWTDDETIIQLATIGPWQINYLNPADDPRKK